MEFYWLLIAFMCLYLISIIGVVIACIIMLLRLRLHAEQQSDNEVGMINGILPSDVIREEENAL